MQQRGEGMGTRRGERARGRGGNSQTTTKSPVHGVPTECRVGRKAAGPASAPSDCPLSELAGAVGSSCGGCVARALPSSPGPLPPAERLRLLLLPLGESVILGRPGGTDASNQEEGAT